MKDCRCPFDEAVEMFEGFLEKQGWNTELLWLNRDHVTGHKRKFFIFRPSELEDSSESRAFYEDIRKTEFNIRIDAFCEFKSKTIAYVSKLDGPSKLLNLGCPSVKKIDVTFIENRFLWKLALRGVKKHGLTPFLKHTEIPRTRRSSQFLSRSALQS